MGSVTATISKRFLAFGAGLALLLAASELAVRAPGWWWHFVRGPNPSDGGSVVLCLGNSHTQGMDPDPATPYPAQLEKILRARSPLAGYSVVNEGLAGMNSAQIVALLPEWLSRYHPSVVAVMTGETNSWNWSRPGILDNSALYRFLRVSLNPSFSKQEQFSGMSCQFNNVPLSETATLARRWAATLALPYAHSPNMYAAYCGPEEAKAALERWISGQGANDREALTALARVVGAEGDADKSLALLARAHDAGPDFLVQQALEDLEPKLNQSPAYASLRAKLTPLSPQLRAVLDSARTPNPMAPWGGPGLRGLSARPLFARLSTAELRALTEALPSWFAPYWILSERFEAEGKREDAQAILLRGHSLAAFRADTPPPFVVFARVAELGGAAPLAKGLSATFFRAYPAESPVDNNDSALEHDLREIISLSSAAGARVVLQTYPPVRDTWRERAPDTTIRRVAATAGVTLADTSRRFAALSRATNLEGFYRKNGPAHDDHLNPLGNHEVAEELAGAILGK